MLKTFKTSWIVLNQASLYWELAYVLALVTLELDYFSVFWVLNYSTIADKFLFKCLHWFLFIMIISDPLGSSKGPPSISLLNSYMNTILSVQEAELHPYLHQQMCQSMEISN